MTTDENILSSWHAFVSSRRGAWTMIGGRFDKDWKLLPGATFNTVRSMVGSKPNPGIFDLLFSAGGTEVPPRRPRTARP